MTRKFGLQTPKQRAERGTDETPKVLQKKKKTTSPPRKKVAGGITEGKKNQMTSGV